MDGRGDGEGVPQVRIAEVRRVGQGVGDQPPGDGVRGLVGDREERPQAFREGVALEPVREDVALAPD